MALSLTRAAETFRAPVPEWLRRGVVCGCTLALILAGPALPY